MHLWAVAKGDCPAACRTALYVLKVTRVLLRSLVQLDWQEQCFEWTHQLCCLNVVQTFTCTPGNLMQQRSADFNSCAMLRAGQPLAVRCPDLQCGAFCVDSRHARRMIACPV